GRCGRVLRRTDRARLVCPASGRPGRRRRRRGMERAARTGADTTCRPWRGSTAVPPLVHDRDARRVVGRHARRWWAHVAVPLLAGARGVVATRRVARGMAGCGDASPRPLVGGNSAGAAAPAGRTAQPADLGDVRCTAERPTLRPGDGATPRRRAVYPGP